MVNLCSLIWCAITGLFRSPAVLQAEVLVLRHQLNILQRISSILSSLGGSSVLFSKQEPRSSYRLLGATILQDFFSAKHWGVPFIDVIPDMPKRLLRDEVLAWLKTHPKVKRFVVIGYSGDGGQAFQLMTDSG